MASKEQINDHINRCVHLVRSALMKRAISSIEPDPDLNFWRLILGNHMDIAVLEWCKLFGSNNESTHWKKVVPVDKHESFREGLFAYVKVDLKIWGEYWHELKDYRDNVAAHFNQQSPVPRYPELEIAIRSSCYYYKYLINELKKYGKSEYPDELEKYCKRFEEQTKEIAQIAMSATASIKEKVN